MTSLLRPVTALLLSAAILLLGNGLNGVLLPIRAVGEHFTRLEIGLVGSAYFAGLMLGCLIGPAIIARVGHIRAFVAFTAIATITPLCIAMSSLPWVWWGLRGLNGLCFAGLFMAIESWLNGVSEAQTRGRVFAAYTTINLTVVTIGMQLLNLGSPMSFELFSLTAMLYSLAAVPIALTKTSAPPPPRRAQLHLLWVFNVSPAAMLGSLLSGVANSAFWGLAPLYASSAGLPDHGIALFMTIVVLGGAASQWPIGHLSDRLGRRTVTAFVTAVAAAAGITLYFLGSGEAPPVAIYVLAGLYGAMAFPVYALCVAHANDLVHRKRAVAISSGLLLTFSIGAVFGPLLASLMMAQIGNPALFLHTAIAHVLIAFVMVLRLARRPKQPGDKLENYVAVPGTTPAMFDLDPRSQTAGGADRGSERV